MNPLLHRYVRVPVHVPPRRARLLPDAMMHLALRSRIGASATPPTAAPRRSPLRHTRHERHERAVRLAIATL